MKLVIALAAGLLATGALAQSTTSTTTTTAPGGMDSTTGSVTHNSTAHSTAVKTTGKVTHTAMRGHKNSSRKCYTQVRHGKKTRVCRARHNQM